MAKRISSAVKITGDVQYESVALVGAGCFYIAKDAVVEMDELTIEGKTLDNEYHFLIQPESGTIRAEILIKKLNQTAKIHRIGANGKDGADGQPGSCGGAGGDGCTGGVGGNGGTGENGKNGENAPEVPALFVSYCPADEKTKIIVSTRNGAGGKGGRGGAGGKGGSGGMGHDGMRAADGSPGQKGNDGNQGSDAGYSNEYGVTIHILEEEERNT